MCWFMVLMWIYAVACKKTSLVGVDVGLAMPIRLYSLKKWIDIEDLICILVQKQPDGI